MKKIKIYLKCLYIFYYLGFREFPENISNKKYWDRPPSYPASHSISAESAVWLKIVQFFGVVGTPRIMNVVISWLFQTQDINTQ